VRKKIINFFIIFNICAVLFASSNVIPKIPGWQQLVYPYLIWTRLAQTWWLFPDPRRESMKFRFEIEFKDKTTKTWVRPYPPNWDFFERHLSYNFQKLDLAAPALLKDPAVQKDFSGYVMRLHWSDENPPETVKLVVSRAPWPKPTEKLVYDDKGLFWTDKILATYHVNGRTLE
jgi:hypothetical protein